MPEATHAFHFIRPLWLLALVPLGLLAWRLARDVLEDPWTRIVDAPLLQLLRAGGAPPPGRAAAWLLAAGWSVAVLALADPTWERRPQPVYQTNAARVVVLDLSDSMYASDLEPSRLVRARYTIEDVLALGTEGLTGLVAYAGDAFTVSPLTRDANTIRALLKVLEPSLMPAPGSRADLGLLKAGELLRHAGASDGQVLLIADGVDPDKLAASERAAAQLKREGYRVSVLGVGTAQGAPITNAQGRLVRDTAGRIIDTRMDAARLEALARAGGGRYRAIDDGGHALRALVEKHAPLHGTRLARSVSGARGWKQLGPLLALLLLPLGALAFRRNWLLVLLCAAGLGAPVRPALASAWGTPAWRNLWQRPDQQSAAAFAAGDYARAAELAPDPARRGGAQYRGGDYLHALESFSKDRGADADYNRGNALARLGRYQEAVAAYAQALKARPGMDDARANKAAVEALLKKQPQKKQPPQASGSNRNARDGEDGKNGHPSEPQPGDPKQADAGVKPQAAQAPGAQKPPAKSFAEAAKKLADAGMRKSSTEPRPGTPSAQSPAQLAQSAGQRAPRGPQADPGSSAQKLDSEERMAAEQWLRRIPDDPGGLLRRKFLYQYRQRAQQQPGGG